MATLTHKEDCPQCGKVRSLAVYDNRFAKCFYDGCPSGGRWTGPDTAEQAPKKGGPVSTLTKQDLKILPAGPFEQRGISQQVAADYRYHRAQLGKQIVHAAEYPNGSLKVRTADKKFMWAGPACSDGFFGWHLVGDTFKGTLIITEGELDALSVAQSLVSPGVAHADPADSSPLATASHIRSVSVPGGAGAVSDCIKSVDFKRFDKVVVWFDKDDSGQAGLAKAVQALGPTVPYLPGPIPAGCKDANDVLLRHGPDAVRRVIEQSRPYRPPSILDIQDIDWEQSSQPVLGHKTGYACLDENLYGFRRGEFVLFTAGSGVGKTTLVHEIGYHYAFGPEKLKGGYLFLEDPVNKTAQHLVALHHSVPLDELRRNPSLVGPAKLAAFKKHLKTNNVRICFYDHFGSLGSDKLLDTLTYMVEREKCDFLILDHISIAISGLTSSREGERKDIDILMTRLASFVVQHNVLILGICHLSNPDGTPHEEGGRVLLNHLRGSGSLKQASWTIIAGERNGQGPYPSHVLYRSLKDRETGFTGPLGVLQYQKETGRLVETSMSPREFDELARGSGQGKTKGKRGYGGVDY